MNESWVNVCSPLSGTVASLDSVPDPQFAMGSYGAGIAVVPDPWVEVTEIRAPFNARIKRAAPNMYVFEELREQIPVFTLEEDPEQMPMRSVLVHVGVDTGRLNGQGFSSHVEQGDVVTKGAPICTYVPRELGRMGFDPIVMIVALRQPVQVLDFQVLPGEPCTRGDVLFRF